ncbi:type II toxin-antitoxin system RatA family toxin [Salinarimonas sp. NSM]|uniref:type II toxin-antitoxin system RatA family toxin n=1 Tax=Salinarimonas sp. NSM TaxID=3458003 RepID=UPI0040353FA6
MPSFRTTRRVRHTPDEMFALVADVEQYPKFVPLCEDLKVRRKVQSGEGVETLVADMTVGYKRIRESFTSRVTLDPARNRIDVEYVNGPFRYMENRWTFKPAGEGACDVEFYINYEFKNFALGMLMGTMFDRAFRKFSEAFEARADAIYR